ncbi:MAG: helix-turn-helix domain-containing protein [Zoogloeaceae bacterium]|jgi:CRP-like cAMP-binding protein|nr:helix-turn-helix domain-containing protein [Zoogloeaceae bacterium]
MARAPAAQRLANYLLNLRARQENGVIELPVNQRQLAATLGIRAETLNRLLSGWLQRGYIRGKRRCWELVELQVPGRIAQAQN